jgi:hypothetical protein
MDIKATTQERIRLQNIRAAVIMQVIRKNIKRKYIPMSLGIAAKAQIQFPRRNHDIFKRMRRSRPGAATIKQSGCSQKNHERKFFASPAVINDHHQRNKHHSLLLAQKSHHKT